MEKLVKGGAIKKTEKDPLAELRRIGKKAGIDKYTLKQLRGMAREEAEKEAFGILSKWKVNT